MAVSIDWPTKVITVPQADLTHITGTLYELDTNWFRLQLKALEAGEVGIVEVDTHDHITTYTVAGVTYARKVEIINGYKVQFTPDAQWSVRLSGSNNNIFDVENGILVQNQVQVIAQNSAGLQVVTSGSGVTEQDKLDIADRVMDELLAGHTIEGSTGAILSAAKTSADGAKTSADSAATAAGQAKTSADGAKTSADGAKASADAAGVLAGDAATAAELVAKIETGRWQVDVDAKQLVFYDPDTGEEIKRFNLLDEDGEPSAESVYERVPV